MRIKPSVKQKNISRQVSATKSNPQISAQPGDRVYLYGDRTYQGTLIHPLERTSPPRWTVELDNGTYDAVMVSDFVPMNSPNQQRDRHISENLEIPFSDDDPYLIISQREKEINSLQKELIALKKENQKLQEEIEENKQTIRNAKNISPIVRLSLKRVLRLAAYACMDVQKTVGGWILRMGDKARKFRRLSDIWDILIQDNWFLSDVFPPDKLIPINKIQPPKPRKRPTPREKQTFPFPLPYNTQIRQKMGLTKAQLRH